jgi:cytochrome c oxidase subunit 2
MKLNHFLISLFALIFLAGCTLIKSPQTAPTNETGAVAQDDENDDADDKTGANDDDADDADDETGVNNDEANDDQDDTAVKTITIDAKRWEYIPNTITVKQGEKVKLVINDLDTKHGIKFREMEVTEVDGGVMLDTSKPGTYIFYCPTFCGEGHRNMNGTVIVTE